MKSNNDFRQLVKQCLAEVVVESPTYSDGIVEQSSPLPERSQKHTHSSKFKSLISECIKEVLKENLLNDAFDPTSQGPNPVEENPYPAWNSQMQKMEENNNRGDTNQFESRDQVIKYIYDSGKHDEFVSLYGREPSEYFSEYADKEPDIWYWVMNDLGGLSESNDHGRYAQQAGAGQFDARTFGKLDENPELNETRGFMMKYKISDEKK